MTLTLRYAARSDRGLIRSGNQDSVYAGPRLLAVADGMGGMAAGEVASRLAISTSLKLFQRSERWGFRVNHRVARELFERISQDLREKYKDVIPTTIPTFPGGDWEKAINDGWYRNVAPNVDRSA